LRRVGADTTPAAATARPRGDWILRRVLGTLTPPPLADAGTLPADDQTFGGRRGNG
jgi:hypothetical protein